MKNASLALACCLTIMIALASSPNSIELTRTYAVSPFAYSRTFQSAASPAIDPAVISAAHKALPSVVTVVGTKRVTAKQIRLSEIVGNDVLLQRLGINPADFQIVIETPAEQVTSGSGFIATQNGYIITNNHVVDDPEEAYSVHLHDGTKKSATVVYRDPENDIAVIKIDGTYANTASLGDSSELKLGQAIAAIGNAYGQGKSISLGNISGFNRNIVAEGEETVERLRGMIQSNARIAPGYSGGPVIDANGNVIGMNVAKGSRASFMIPINMIKNSVAQYIS